MSLPNYGVLVGTITGALDSPAALRKNPGGKPHYQILVEAESEQYRIAVNVKSDQQPSDLQCYLNDTYDHPVLEHLKALPLGFSKLPPLPNTAVLDYIRGNLFDFGELRIMPTLLDGPSNDLNDIFDVHVQQAINTEGALVYAFGSKWEDGPHDSDPYFGFRPGQGIHDIHMNQGNTGSHAGDNGVYQDGGLFIYYPDEKRWVAMFMKFQSQFVHTDDNHADPVEPEAETLRVKIFAAQVNPIGNDVGRETVYLLNTTNAPVNLDGWMIADKMKKKEVISNTVLSPFDTVRIVLSGNGAQLSNEGGIITLLDKGGLKVDGVSYTKSDADKQDIVLPF